MAAPSVSDSVYNGPQLPKALAKIGDWTIEIVKRTAAAAGFELLPAPLGGRMVERILAWLNRNRRLAKDFAYERYKLDLHRFCKSAY